MQAWFDSGKVQMLNDPKIHTRIHPVTGRGSTLDLAIINPSLRSKVVHFKVDTYRRWSLHGTITSKSTGRIQIGKGSDHKGSECKLKVTILAATKAGNSPVIMGQKGSGVDITLYQIEEPLTYRVSHNTYVFAISWLPAQDYIVTKMAGLLRISEETQIHT